MKTKIIKKAFPAIKVMLKSGEVAILDSRKLQQEIKTYPAFFQDNERLFNYEAELINDLYSCVKNLWGNTVKISSNEYVPFNCVEKFVVLKDYFLYDIDLYNNVEDNIVSKSEEDKNNEEEPTLNVMGIEKFSETVV